jgi:hypothetical protein
VLATAREVIEQLFGAFMSWDTFTLPALCCTEASREIEDMGQTQHIRHVRATSVSPPISDISLRRVK